MNILCGLLCIFWQEGIIWVRGSLCSVLIKCVEVSAVWLYLMYINVSLFPWGKRMWTIGLLEGSLILT